MACQPTPISTLFSTSTSILTSTITSSSAVLITPSASTSTWVTSICTTPTGDPVIDQISTSSSSSIMTSSSYTSPSIESSSSSIDGSAITSFSVASPAVSDATSGSPTSPIGELQEPQTTLAVLDGQTLSGEESSSILNGLTTSRRARRFARRLYGGHKIIRRQDTQDCQTITSTSTILPTPTTSWSLIFIPTESTSLIEVPTDTIMGGCESTSAPESTVSSSPVNPMLTSSIASVSASPITSDTIAPSSTSIVATDQSSESSTSNLSSSSIPSQTSFLSSTTPTTSSPLSTAQTTNGYVPSDPLSAVFTGPTLTSETIDSLVGSSTVDPLAPITSDALQPDPAETTWDQSASSDIPVVQITDSSSIASSTEPSITSTKAVIPGAAIAETSSSNLPPSLASQNSKPTLTLNHNSSSSSGENEVEEGSNGSNKHNTAGAVVGGIFALIALIAVILFLIRWWKKRQRVEKTKLLRSSWFYGGKDLTDAQENEKRRSETVPPPLSRIPPISRFSAPSFASRSEGLGALLSRPLKHFNKDSSSSGIKPLKLVSGDPNDETNSDSKNLISKLILPFRNINLPSSKTISDTLRNLPGGINVFGPKKTSSFIIKSRNISSPQPIQPEINDENERRNGIFDSKLFPIFSKFQSIRKSFKRTSFSFDNMKYVSRSQIESLNHDQNSNSYDEKNDLSNDSRMNKWIQPSLSKDNPIKVNFMQPPPFMNETGSFNSKHGSINSNGNSPYPTIIPNNMNNIGQALSNDLEESKFNLELNYKPTHVQLRHLTWGSSYANPGRTSILSSNGMLITLNGEIATSEDGNSIYSKTSLSHGHGSLNLNRNGTLKSNISDSNDNNNNNNNDQYLKPPKSCTSLNSDSQNMNIPSPSFASNGNGSGAFAKHSFSPLSAGSGGSRGSFGILPSVPEYPNDEQNMNKEIKDLRRITRSTAHSSGIWEYSAYVDGSAGSSGGNSNSKRGSNGKDQSSQFQNQGQLKRIASTHPPTIRQVLGPSSNNLQYQSQSATMIYPNSSSPIPVEYPPGFTTNDIIQITVPSPNNLNYTESMLKNSNLSNRSKSYPINQNQDQIQNTLLPPNLISPLNSIEGERITKAWYEKPLWDNNNNNNINNINPNRYPNSILLPPKSNESYLYSQKSGNSLKSNNRTSIYSKQSRKSIKSFKSVRWEDEDGLISNTLEGPRAL
ncbi:uncharacterized protein I206_103524 [Kwoniella pini CBS 10737]|uniref:Uncharacterized protein n=1 Tax=Kwoniella pini CBS 10737 TaxID=1296096 RepID=A0A1B9I9R5_9TREE|nr:uncharacterized protein I206_01472 [Kwoniella pini CBS 10737]OCF52187.1 hypothetical protein I206_01472 [Kwoniella pini CBS 10737]